MSEWLFKKIKKERKKSGSNGESLAHTEALV